MNINGKTIGILGMKSSGKTYHTRQICEEISESLIIWDTIGAINVKKSKKFRVSRDFADEAIAWGILMAESKKQNISVNLVYLTQEEIVDFTDIALLTAGTLRNKTIVLDEAAEYLSQTYRQSREMERLIRHGRNFGCTFVFNTQRPAYISKNTLNLVDILIVFRLVWNRDVEALKEVLSNTGMDMNEIKKETREIAQLKQGKFKIYQFGVGDKMQ